MWVKRKEKRGDIEGKVEKGEGKQQRQHVIV